MSRPTRRQIEEADRYQLKRRADFRLAADAVAAALADFEEVSAIALFGSVARPPTREVPRFDPFRRHGVEVVHECKDVDLAVWLTRLDRLAALNRAKGQAVTRLFAATGVGVAQHQVDVFLFEPGADAYLGRLCAYNACPKGKPDCAVPGCGRVALLQQHEDFAIYPDALAEGRMLRLFDRERGWLARAAEMGDEAAARWGGAPPRGSAVLLPTFLRQIRICHICRIMSDPAKPDPSVAAHEIQRHWGEVSDRALRDPIVITSKGRPRHVLMAYDEYQRLKARDRRAYRIEDLPDDLAELLEAGLDELRNGFAEDGDTLIG